MRSAIVSYNFMDGNRYPRSPCSTYLRRASKMGGGAEKSISAIHIGKTSFGNIVHLFSAPTVRRFGTLSKLYAMFSLVPGDFEMSTTERNRLFFVSNDHPIAGRDERDDPIQISSNIPREATNCFGGFFMVVRVKYLSMPDHVIDDQESAVS